PPPRHLARPRRVVVALPAQHPHRPGWRFPLGERNELGGERRPVIDPHPVPPTCLDLAGVRLHEADRHAGGPQGVTDRATDSPCPDDVDRIHARSAPSASLESEARGRYVTLSTRVVPPPLVPDRSVMPLTLEQYVERLDERTALPRPQAPPLDPPSAN